MRLDDVRIPIRKIMTVGVLPSFLKKLVYRLRGYRIGKGVSFGPGSVLDISGDAVQRLGRQGSVGLRLDLSPGTTADDWGRRLEALSRCSRTWPAA